MTKPLSVNVPFHRVLPKKRNGNGRILFVCHHYYHTAPQKTHSLHPPPFVTLCSHTYSHCVFGDAFNANARERERGKQKVKWELSYFNSPVFCMIDRTIAPFFVHSTANTFLTDTHLGLSREERKKGCFFLCQHTGRKLKHTSFKASCIILLLESVELEMEKSLT